MPKGDPAGYLPNVKKARKRGESRKVAMIPRPGMSNPRAYVPPGESYKNPGRKPRYAAPKRSA